MKLNHLFNVLAGSLSLAIAGIAQADAPNFYECSGRNASLTLTVGSGGEVGIVAPQTVLNLQIGARSYTFGQQDITKESTLPGELWEVTLKHIPDQYIRSASVVIPSINLGSEPIGFDSQLILTTLNTPLIQPPFVGVVNPSRYIDLKCTASFVYF